MNTELFYLSLLQLGLTLFVGLAMLFLTFKLVHKRIVVRYNLEYNNIALAILCGAILFSVAYLLTTVREPMINAIKLVQRDPNRTNSLVFESAKYIGLFLAISVVVIGFVNALSLYLFTVMTKGINEFKEIQKENIAVSIITAVIVISMAIMTKDSLMLILESFVPYPDMPKIL